MSSIQKIDTEKLQKTSRSWGFLDGLSKGIRSLPQEVMRNRQSYLLLLPYFILFFGFVVLPVTVAMGFSFPYFNILESPKFIGWANYARLFLEDDVFLIAIKNTFLFVSITGPLSYILCFSIAWFVNELSPKLRSILTLMFYAPSLAGPSTFIIWQTIFSGDSYGLANGILMKLGILLEPVLWLKNPTYILGILIVVQLWLSLGASFLSFIAGLQTIDKSLYEAGTIDGIRNRWQELWYITLPVMRPFLMFGAVIQITASFAVSSVSIGLLGFPTTNYAGRTIVTHLVDYGQVRFEMGYACAIATILFAVMVTANKIVQRYLKNIGS